MKATTSRQLPIEEVNTLDIEKTKSYYNQIRNEDLCDCDYCRNNIHEVKAAYPTSFMRPFQVLCKR